jgi:virginiamycin B lyase
MAMTLGGWATAAPTALAADPSVVISTFSDPSISSPTAIAVGSDGALWFTNLTGNSIGRITTAGAVSAYSDPTINGPTGLASGPDGALWFDDWGDSTIGRITTAGAVTNFAGGGVSASYAITTGPDGALWFTNQGNNSIGRITTAGTITNFTSAKINSPTGIVAGPDGALWFADWGAGSIGRITTAGAVTTYPEPSARPTGITVGPDGALWFTDANGAVGRVTTGGVVTLFIDPSMADPTGITVGPDGALWFTNTATDTIDRITTAGVVTSYGLMGASPEGIIQGPDGALWFTMNGSNEIGRLALVPAAPGPPRSGGSPPPPKTATVTRVAGADRVATAIAVSQATYPASGSAGAVVIARADDFADALAGTALAANRKAPVLLTQTGALDPATQAEVQRVLPAGGTVYLLGGMNALSPAVADTLGALGYQVVRYGGANRFATAVAVADALGDPTSVLLADGTTFSDALGAGPAAAHIGGAVLLTDGASMPPDTAAYLAAHPQTALDAIGGPAATADPAAAPVVGADRYATAVAVAQRFFTTPTTAGLASGVNFPDALSGAAAVAVQGAPMLLTDPGALSPETGAYLQSIASTLTTIQVYGGTLAVSAEAAASATQDG